MTPARIVVLAIVLAGCGRSGGNGGGSAQGDTLTTRQRDSILAESRIPGARGVGTAHNVADSASARVRLTDTIAP
jgi:hypothetical protein